jgi:hypothetical protein
MNIDNFIDHKGSVVTHKTVTITEADATYGTPDESFSAGVSIKIIPTIAEGDDRLVAQGILEIGDLKATVKSDLTIAEGDIIIISGAEWEVVHVSQMLHLSNTLYRVIGLKKRLAGTT